MATTLALAFCSPFDGVAGDNCLRFHRPPVADSSNCPPSRAGMSESDRIGHLLATIDADIKAGAFGRAERALACASGLTAQGPWSARYETVRRHGVLDYRRERVPQALQAFECALAIAERHGHRPGIAKQNKNIGAALMRLGDFRGAQAALGRSLALQRADDSRDIGSVLNNLGDLYREQHDHANALDYYRQALEHYREAGEEIEVAHTLETISVLSLDRGDTRTATALLTRAMHILDNEGHQPYRLRVYAGLIRAARMADDRVGARRWSNESLAFATRHHLTLPAALQLQIARVQRGDGAPDAAISRLGEALRGLPITDPSRSALLEERALALSDVGAHAEAIAMLRAAKDAEKQDVQARFDQRIAWQRSRLEAAERERRIAELETLGRQRRLEAGIAVLLAIAVALGAGLYALRRTQRAREAAAAERARYEEALHRYRSEADALNIDRRLLRALLATHEGAVCLLDADGHMLAANREACRLLDAEESSLLGTAFSAQVRPEHRPQLAQVLYNIEEHRSGILHLVGISGTDIQARVTQWEEEAGVLILSLQVRPRASGTRPEDTPPANGVDPRRALPEVGMDAAVAAPQGTVSQGEEPQDVPPHQEDPRARTVPGGPEEEQARRRFRRRLVELMLSAIEHWERSTGTNRIELAERSRIWRIGIDDGRLRARAMERYLSLGQLPRHPRWRDVLRTVYYVLGHCTLDADVRDDLQRGVDEILAYCRRDAYIEQG